MVELKDHRNKFQPPKRCHLVKYVYRVLRPNQFRIHLITICFLAFGFIRLFLHQSLGILDNILTLGAIASLAFSIWNLSLLIFNDGKLNIETNPQANEEIAKITGITPIPLSEAVLYDLSLNEWLQKQPTVIMIKDQNIHSSIRSKIRARADSMEKLLRTNFKLSVKNHRQFSDDSKICLGEDIVSNMRECKFFIGSYYDSYCTNEFCAKLLHDTSPNQELVASGLDILPVKNGRLQPIAESFMNNHIGISTLAITSDGYIRLWKQGNKTQIARGMIVATGSGSLDDQDLSQSCDLLETIRNGMEREFREESSKEGMQFSKDPVVETRVTGYFRWVNRGGKPEFVGVTRLRVPNDDLKPNNAEVEAANYVRGNLVLPARSWEELNEVLDDYLHNRSSNAFSPSCWVALKCLHNLAKSKPADWTDFLFHH
jgi:hypothetical protein